MNKNNPNENFFYGTIFSYGVLLTIWFLAYIENGIFEE